MAVTAPKVVIAPPSPVHSPRTKLIEATEKEIRGRLDPTPYTQDDLPRIVNTTRRTHDFRGSLVAQEIYAATAQHLSEYDYNRWMGTSHSAHATHHNNNLSLEKEQGHIEQLRERSAAKFQI